MDDNELVKKIAYLEKRQPKERFYYTDLQLVTKKDMLADLGDMLHLAQSRIKTRGYVQENFQKDLAKITGTRQPKNVKLESLTRGELQKVYSATQRYLSAQTSTKGGKMLHDLRVEYALRNKDISLPDEQKKLLGFIQSKESFKKWDSDQIVNIVQTYNGNLEDAKKRINSLLENDEEITIKSLSKELEVS